jgi:hypothetical protein
MTTLNLNNINDDLIEINRDTFSNKQMSFNIPSKQQRANQNNFMSEDVLFNKNKISNDVISMSSRSSSRSSSRASSVNGDYDKSAYMKNMNNIYKNKGNASGAGGGIKKMKSKYDEDSESSSVVSSSINKKSGSGGGGSGSSGGGSSNKYKKQSRYEDDDDEDEEDDDDGEDEDDEGEYEEDDGEEDEDGEEGDEGDEGEEGDYKRGGKTRHLTAKEIIMNELNEKREIIYQLDRLESKGFKIPFKFNMNSDLEEMRTEYNRLIREKELDGSVRFQQKMLMAFISGTEYMNSRYDPFAIKLDGWSEQVNENINDYDDIFEELHYKYKATGKKMAPELRLFISLSGSAFMFHLTSRMFKDQPLPNVENVLKSDPELMKQFQQAAAKQYMMGNTGGNYNQMPPPMSAMPQMSSMASPQNVPVNNYSNPMSSMGMGDSGGLFGMVSSLFSTLNTPQSSMSMPQMSSQSNNANIRQSPNITELRQKPAVDIENIINNVHNNISIDNNDNNIETLSVSDEEITSIIEDTADIKILRGVGRPRKNTRTLNI